MNRIEDAADVARRVRDDALNQIQRRRQEIEAQGPIGMTPAQWLGTEEAKNLATVAAAMQQVIAYSPQRVSVSAIEVPPIDDEQRERLFAEIDVVKERIRSGDFNKK